MIVDAHCHIFPYSFPQRYPELVRRDSTFAALFPRAGGRMATAEDLLSAMDAAGVERAVTMGFGWTDPEVAREANDYIIQATDRNPARLAGFCSVNPAWGDAALAEVERCARLGIMGIGELHSDSQAFELTSRKAMAPLMDLAHSLGLPVLLHCSEPVGHAYPGKGSATPDKVYRFLRHFPENTVICAHWGGGLAFYGLMPEIPRELKNVYFDTAASPLLYQPQVFSVAAQTIGAQRILFATDYPLLRHRRVLAQVEECRLDAESRMAILGSNACRALQWPPGGPARCP